MTCSEAHSNYIKDYLIKEILNNLKGESLECYEVQHLNGIDGFMSTLYNITLCTKTSDGTNTKHNFFVKLMRGDSNFRETSKSYIQFANEIFTYVKVLPLYKEFLQQVGVSEFKVEDWVAPCYVAKFGYIEGLSVTRTDRDSVLVLANLKTCGYSLGPRIYLTRHQLLKMARPLGQFHAMTYALRLRDDSRLDQLKAGIVTLPFINEQDLSDDTTNLYTVFYRAAFDRFYDYFDRVLDDDIIFKRSSAEDQRLIANIQRLREKYFAHPTHLLEHLRTSIDLMEEDQRFATILHGDYNRNNVLFRCENKGLESGDDADFSDPAEVESVKMIDFQEMRYGTPAIDVSLFMYINTNSSVRDAVWPEILRSYHSSMFHTLSTVLKASSINDTEKIEENLKLYNYENFYRHFARFAFYGALVSMHFLPYLLCSVEECERLSHLFETDMHSKAFHQLFISAGGDRANKEILEVVRHASRMGYMDNI